MDREKFVKSMQAAVWGAKDKVNDVAVTAALHNACDAILAEGYLSDDERMAEFRRWLDAYESREPDAKT